MPSKVSWNPWTGPSTPEAVALVILGINSHTSAACIRLQKRFRLLGTRTMAASRLSHLLKGRLATDSPVLVTAWDAGNAEGDKLSEAMMSALRMLLNGAGADLHGMPPQPGSICCDHPDGTVLLGPVTDTAVTMEVVPQDDPSTATQPVAAAKGGGKSLPQASPPKKDAVRENSGNSKGATAASASAATATKPPAPNVIQLTIVREGGGVRVDLARRKPLVEVVVKRPSQLQRERLLVRGEASDFRSRDARGRVAERQMQRRVRADAVAVPQCGRRAAAQDIHAALQKIVDGELTVRDG